MWIPQRWFRCCLHQLYQGRINSLPKTLPKVFVQLLSFSSRSLLFMSLVRVTGSLVGIQYIFYEENYSAFHFWHPPKATKNTKIWSTNNSRHLSKYFPHDKFPHRNGGFQIQKSHPLDCGRSETANHGSCHKVALHLQHEWNDLLHGCPSKNDHLLRLSFQGEIERFLFLAFRTAVMDIFFPRCHPRDILPIRSTCGVRLFETSKLA